MNLTVVDERRNQRVVKELQWCLCVSRRLAMEETERGQKSCRQSLEEEGGHRGEGSLKAARDGMKPGAYTDAGKRITWSFLEATRETFGRTQVSIAQVSPHRENIQQGSTQENTKRAIGYHKVVMFIIKLNKIGRDISIFARLAVFSCFE